MAELPLLMFPDRIHVDRTKLRGFSSRPSLPDHRRQARRLEPQLRRLQDAFDRQRVILQDNAFGVQPEQVLVVETVGSVEDFITVTRSIKGLEWLGEFELEDIGPDYGFEVEGEADKNLKGRLFLIMSDQRAMDQIQRLFRQWKDNADTDFPRGLTKLKSVFEQLYDIRPWDIQERIRETGVLADWNQRITAGQEVVHATIELWFRRSVQTRSQSAQYVRKVVSNAGGDVVDECIISQIAYHALLITIPIARIRSIITEIDEPKDRQIELVQCESIMYLRPSGQCLIDLPESDEDQTEMVIAGKGLAGEKETREEVEGQKCQRNEPIVALLDGVPLMGHELIQDRVTLDDPDDYQARYQARDRQHGTMMASLICHGDLNQAGPKLNVSLYVRPILSPRRDFHDCLIEEIPEEALPVDLIHRSIRRILDGDGGEGPSAPNVRIINISVCDRSRPFYREISPLARLLDWLSWKHNVLFVVSAGNHTSDIELDIPRDSMLMQPADTLGRKLIKANALDTRNRRILSPAESINSLTLGASHVDASQPLLLNNQRDPFSRQGLPSLISGHGPGYRGATKPDILLPGGRHVVTEPIANHQPNAVAEIRSFVTAPGQLVAVPGAQTAVLDAVAHSRGTSNAAALATRAACQLHEVLQQVGSELGDSIPTDYFTVLMKTLLVHAADWNDIWREYKGDLESFYGGGSIKQFASRFIGYGSANTDSVMECTDQRVTALGFGELLSDQGEEFAFPLPPSLSNIRVKRRLKITLAWLTPINSMNRKYRVADLWFEGKTALAKGTRICADRRVTRRGTVQQEVFEGTLPVEFEDGENLVVRVNCRSDAGEIVEPIRYGLAVTLQVAEGIAIPIYQEIRDRFAIRIRV